jgi:hypothetical protein
MHAIMIVCYSEGKNMRVWIIAQNVVRQGGSSLRRYRMLAVVVAQKSVFRVKSYGTSH